jgi:hypothetical protein
MPRPHIAILGLFVAVVLVFVLLGSLHQQGHITLPMVKELLLWEDIKAPKKGELSVVEELIDGEVDEETEVPPFDDYSVRIYIGVVITLAPRWTVLTSRSRHGGSMARGRFSEKHINNSPIMQSPLTRSP